MSVNITTLKINGLEIGDYSQYIVYNHIVKANTPSRSDAFSYSDINKINQAIVPEIAITFKYIPIDLYRALNAITQNAEFLVEYYDYDYSSVRKGMFYRQESDTVNPHEWGASRFLDKNKALLGFKDYNLKLVATLNPISFIDMRLLDSNAYPYNRPYKIKVAPTVIGTTIKIDFVNVEDLLYDKAITIDAQGNKVFSYNFVDLKQGASKIETTCRISFNNKKLSIANATSESNGVYTIQTSDTLHTDLQYLQKVIYNMVIILCL